MNNLNLIEAQSENHFFAVSAEIYNKHFSNKMLLKNGLVGALDECHSSILLIWVS